MSSRPTLSLALLAAALMISLAPAQTATGGTVITSFDSAEDVKSWRAVNDNVMGGISKGGPAYENGRLVFAGETRLENNGGFSSLRTRGLPIDLSGQEELVIRVRGDASRKYIFSLETNARRGGWRIAYWQDFGLKGDGWQEVVLPLSGFRPTSFGYDLDGPALEIEKVRSMGIMVYDKKAGPFRIECDWIKSRGAAAKSTVTASNRAAKRPSGGNTIVDVAAGAGQFETLLAAATAAGLAPTLQSDGPFTVFAPTDAAFAKLGNAKIQDLLKKENRDTLKAILLYHVVPGRVEAGSLLTAKSAKTVQGDKVRAGIDGGRLKVNDANILTVDVAASNGLVHIIDSVLIPTLPEKKPDIVTLATNAGMFGTLLTAVKTAGLAETLLGDGPFTVFAPTDDAFKALPNGTVEALLRPENREQLREILTYHVISGRLLASDLVRAGKATTVNGAELIASLDKGQLKAGPANVVSNDLVATNGVVHVIDQVLLPPTNAKPGPIAGLIESAIDKGAPLFNDGNPAACAAVYEMAVTALVTLETPGLKSHVRADLVAALARSEGMRDREEAAWVLRRAMDAAWDSLPSR